MKLSPPLLILFVATASLPATSGSLMGDWIAGFQTETDMDAYRGGIDSATLEQQQVDQPNINAETPLLRNSNANRQALARSSITNKKARGAYDDDCGRKNRLIAKPDDAEDRRLESRSLFGWERYADGLTTEDVSWSTMDTKTPTEETNSAIPILGLGESIDKSLSGKKSGDDSEDECNGDESGDSGKKTGKKGHSGKKTGKKGDDDDDDDDDSDSDDSGPVTEPPTMPPTVGPSRFPTNAPNSPPCIEENDRTVSCIDAVTGLPDSERCCEDNSICTPATGLCTDVGLATKCPADGAGSLVCAFEPQKNKLNSNCGTNCYAVCNAQCGCALLEDDKITNLCNNAGGAQCKGAIVPTKYGGEDESWTGPCCGCDCANAC